MRWWTFLPLLMIVLTLQSALAASISLFGVRPDGLLAIVVFFSLFGRRTDALIGAWLVGLSADLLTIERTGLLALTYTVSAAIVISIRDSIFRHQLATQLFVTLVLACMVQLGWLVYRRLMYAPFASIWTELPAAMILAPLYTALLGVLLYPGLSKMNVLLGLPRPRYTLAPSGRSGRDHV